MKVKLSFLLAITISLFACTKEPIVISNTIYDCDTRLANTHPRSAQFDAFLAAKVAEGIPGINMLIETPEGIWIGSAGVADIPNNIPLQACNVSRVGSITKTFTATLILQLAEQGQLALSDVISKHLDSDMSKKIANADIATIEDLLTHTSGIEDYSEQIDFSVGLLNDMHKHWTAEKVLAYIYDNPALFEPGAQRKYSNSNYALLGLIAEKVTGKKGATLFQEQIFGPLNLQQTSFNQDNRIPENIVRGYADEEDDGVLIDRTEFTFAHGTMEGGAISTVEDLRTFIQAALTTDKLFSAATIERMLKVVPPSGEDHTVSKKEYTLAIDGIALGWFNIKTPFGKGYGHGGSLRGYRGFMAYFPDTQTTLCYLTNGNEGQVKALEKEMLRNELVPLIFE